MDIRCREENEKVKKIKKAILNCEEHIVGKIDDKKIILKLEDVLYFESVDRNTYAYTIKDIVKISNKLNELDDSIFYGYFRISKSMVINVIHISNIVKHLNGNLDVTMDNGEHIIVSRRYVSEFNRFIKKGK